MASASIGPSRDWVRGVHSYLLAWSIPQAGMFAALFLPVPIRVVVWIVALIWMGTACIFNARRCKRTHCRYTGPYYLAMTAPVVAPGLGILSAGRFAWGVFGVLILAGSKLIWWATERAWGEFS